MRMRRWVVVLAAASAGFSLPGGLFWLAAAATAPRPSAPAAGPAGAPVHEEHLAAETRTGTLIPGRPSAVPRVAPPTPAEHEALLAAHLDARDRAAAPAVGRSRSVQGAADPGAADAPPTEIAAAGRTLAVDINNRNTVAQSVSSTLAEPAAANERRESGDGTDAVLWAGNTYRAYSKDRGSSWTSVGVPAGPSDAPRICCDFDVVDHVGTATTFTSGIYLNTTQTNGVVRIFVRPDNESADTCFYDIDPGGTSNNVVPDYPHIATSNGFLYLSTNNLRNGVWIGSQMYRIPVNRVATCQSLSFDVFTHTGSVGQRVFTPAEGATTAMFWGAKEQDGASADSFRLFRWREADASPTSAVYTDVINSNFTNPDCRGGASNTDFVDATSASGIGFDTRGAVGGGQVTFLWTVGPDSSHTQGHLHGATFRTSDLVRVASPVVFNNGFCIAFGVLGSNSRGDLGLSVAAGGKAGGGGPAARGHVAVDDADSAGISFPTLTLVADGNFNRSDGRWGDYLSVRGNHRHAECDTQWVATSFSLQDGNTSPSNVNARYVEFRSSADNPCPK